MEKKGIILKNIVMAPNVPIIEYQKYLALNEPYDFFNEPVCLISTYENIVKNKQEIITGIEEFSTKEIQFYCDIFPEPIYQVAGYIVAIMKDKDAIFLFGYENNKKEEDSNEEYY